MTNVRRLGLIVVMVALVFAFILGSAGSAEASARDANWVVAVTYQNVGTAPANVVVEFYAEGSTTPITFDPLNGGTLAPGAGRSFFIGNVNNVPAGFQGNAIMNSSEPLVSTVVQFSQDPGFKMRLLYNGFQAGDADSQYFIATVLKNKFSRTTVFSIQNTEDVAVDATIDFYDADNNGVLAASITHNIPAKSSKFVAMDVPADTNINAAVFNGSAVITAEKVGGGAGNVVAAASEYYTNANIAADFEGLPLSRAATTVNMSTGLCEQFGLDTFYAVTNAGGSDASITVSYFDKDGNAAGSDGPYVIGPGQKQSIRTCDAVASGFTGSAVVESTGAPIVVIGKAQNSLGAPTPATAEVFTAFLGEATGASELAIPFVRWANDAQYFDPGNTGGRQRSFIAVQNLENVPITVNAEYRDKDGTLAGTHTLVIPAKSKANTNASLAGVLGFGNMVDGAFGYYQDNTFGAAVTLSADASNPTAQFIAINRVQNPGAGEDANAQATP